MERRVFHGPEDAGAAGGARAAGGADVTGALPTLPRPRMPLSQRAKIFIPFDPLKGYQDALREKEQEAERLHHELAGSDFEL